MFLKKYTAHAIMEGILNRDLKIYKYLDANFRWKTINHVRKNSGTKEDGEELYNDILCNIYINIERGKYDPNKGTFQSYFMQIMRNRWNNCLRKRKEIENTLELNEVIENTYADTTDTDDNYYTFISMLKKYVESLKEGEQELIRLFYYEQNSIDAIALQLGMSNDYTKVKLHRTREKLRKLANNDPELAYLLRA